MDFTGILHGFLIDFTQISSTLFSGTQNHPNLHSNDLERKNKFCPSVISQGNDRWNFVSLNPFPLSHILK